MDLHKKGERAEMRIKEIKKKVEMNKILAREKDEQDLKMIENFL